MSSFATGEERAKDCLVGEGWYALGELRVELVRYREFLGPLAIVRKVTHAVEIALRNWRCPDPIGGVAAVISKLLDEVGIDRYSIREGELQGMAPDTLKVIKMIFPRIRQTSRPALPQIERPEYPAYRRSKSKKTAKTAIAIIIIILLALLALIFLARLI